MLEVTGFYQLRTINAEGAEDAETQGFNGRSTPKAQKARNSGLQRTINAEGAEWAEDADSCLWFCAFRDFRVDRR